jgi:16S rRNA (cytosine1402-N4)-methyltransferase
MAASNSFHRPVLVDEAVEYLVTCRDGIYIDAGCGGGGHSHRIASGLEAPGKLLAIDRDREAIAKTRERLKEFAPKVQVVRGEFGRLKELANEAGISSVNGVLFDLGVSGHQLDCARRGFSYQTEGPLDLRMDQNAGLTAGEVVNRYPVNRLVKIVFEFGGEKNAKKIASAIETARRKKELITTTELADVIRTVTNPRYFNKTLSRVFQAIRIEVNAELNQLKQGLVSAFCLLCSGGRLVAIAYHSIEDRLVKTYIRELAGKPIGREPSNMNAPLVPAARMITKKPVTPTDREIGENPRARSARMRVAEKL